ncbi:rhodanese-like domain-containing protein [Sulfitobacter mediterraneus]|jgi:rhodanese-related sulfurtransferase|uniref:Sulfurtransferase n=1 Tax=Sulfitobacter mediterraneus TaxID=83219 RepID=A0A061SX46_9RHOB|nr:rhodanese-like domain-containing protein [Sulfitobacter mediterraneus]KAJ04564.1 sulfurtransferase [Sulfitobacter mediterraneus]KIN78374.1 Rhodanese-like protein [Sulfitobacter mediterraneus KCTC 32188]MBM1310014.1 rhodanese-like domain-containing protein [Sulfitobacter mediterraneus]MBM1313898.1 rhodanese-like domain-containing protein [Sulfitobacter mediterraneus]MBM1322258.1 rhodanese-like domain-containing protein [Sulfitobacter mediterraneus]
MPLKRTSAQMVAEARARIEEIGSADGIAMASDPNVQIVDIRDPRERERVGFIPGSFHCPRGMLEFWVDPDSPYFKEVFGEDKKFVFHCASGWRSAISVATLQDMGFDAAHLKDGFSGWEKAGGPVEKKAAK